MLLPSEQCPPFLQSGQLTVLETRAPILKEELLALSVLLAEEPLDDELLLVHNELLVRTSFSHCVLNIWKASAMSSSVPDT